MTRAIRIILLSTAAVAVTAGSALAQPDLDGLTVYGRRGFDRLPRGEPYATARVGYADLDLTTPEGRDALNWRIRRTADELCWALGEPEEIAQNTSVLPSCQSAARASAQRQVRRAVEDARWRARYAWSQPYFRPPPPAYAPPPDWRAAPAYPCCARPYWGR